MELIWDEFSEEEFRRMKKIIVASANDDTMTMEHIGRVTAGDVHIELYICEEPDEQFVIQRRYFVGCTGRETDSALINVRSEIEGFSYGEYKMAYKPLEYRIDMLYDELKLMIETGFEKAVAKDTAGVLRAAVESPTDFWARARAAVREKAQKSVTQGSGDGAETTLARKIAALAELPAEEFKEAALALVRGE